MSGMEPTISQERRLVLAEPALADMADAFNPSQFKPPQRKPRLQSGGVNGAVQAPVLACRNTQQRAGCVQEHSAGGARQPQAAKATVQPQPGAVAVRLQPCSCTLQVSAAEHVAAGARAEPAPRGRNLRAAASSGVLQRCVCSVALCALRISSTGASSAQV